MASYENEITAGWGITNVLSFIQQIAYSNDVDLKYTKSSGLMGRSIWFKVNGSSDNVENFKSDLLNAINSVEERRNRYSESKEEDCAEIDFKKVNWLPLFLGILVFVLIMLAILK